MNILDVSEVMNILDRGELMDILDKIVKFLDDNEEELKKAVYENEYLGMIREWFIEPDDRKLFKEHKSVIDGPQHRLNYILWYMVFALKDEIVKFKSDNRSREEKYNDSLKRALELEEQRK